MDRSCECCGTNFTNLPTVKNQRYCRKHACQKTRKKLWQKVKLATDQDYRRNQADCRKAWNGKHPEYWRAYRVNHPASVERNREKQRERNRKRPRKGELNAVPMIAKMDEWIVEIGFLSAGCGVVPGSP